MQRSLLLILFLFFATCSISPLHAGQRQSSAESDPESICQAVAENSRDFCYLQYAISRKEKDWCQKITDKDNKESCLNQVQSQNRKEEVKFWNLGIAPQAVAIGEETPVIFTIRQSGSLEKAQIVLEEVNPLDQVVQVWGELRDDAENGDLVAEDFVYSGTFIIPGSNEGERRFRARAIHQGISYDTAIARLFITRFPVGPAVSHMNSFVIDKDGNRFLADEVLVSFKDEVSANRIEEIMKDLGGEIIGTTLPFSYQIRVPPVKSFEELEAVIREFQMYPEIESASDNGLMTLDDWTPVAK